MSRVADALQRAAHDKAQLSSTKLAHPRPPRIDENKIEVLSERDYGLSSLAPQIPAATKTWYERLEEILYGWDLKRLKSHPLVALEKESPVAEQYRILREQLKGLHDAAARSIVITSPVKNEGKTMVAVNLAVSFALASEQQVLLIDGDLRNPQVHRYFGVRSEPGLTEYLTSTANGNLSSYIRPTLVPGLQILPAGSYSELGPELLAKGRLSSLLNETRAAFPAGQVIIDTPPVLATSDPLVLTREVAGVIMVVRAGKTRREYVKKAIETLKSRKLLGIVLNGTAHEISYKYYNHAAKT